MAAHIYDLALSPAALKNAAASGVAFWCPEDSDLTITLMGEWFVIEGGGRRSFRLRSGQDPCSGTHKITLTRASLRAAAKWAEAGKAFGDVFLLIDDTMMLVYQGDDRAGFVAPLDR